MLLSPTSCRPARCATRCATDHDAHRRQNARRASATARGRSPRADCARARRLGAFLILAPLIVIFVQAFSLGVGASFAALSRIPIRCHAIWLTVADRADRRAGQHRRSASPPHGRSPNSTSGARRFLITLIEMPFSVSPIVAGVAYLLRLRRCRACSARRCRRRHQDPVCAAGHRAGLDLRHRPVRRPRTDPADAGAGPRSRGGRALARAPRLAHLLLGHAAQYSLGAALRRGALQRPRHGRVRRGLGRLGQHPRPDQHLAAACRAALPRLPRRPAPSPPPPSWPCSRSSRSSPKVLLECARAPDARGQRLQTAAHPTRSESRHEDPRRHCRKNFDRFRGAAWRLARHRQRRTGRAARAFRVRARRRCCAWSPGSSCRQRPHLLRRARTPRDMPVRERGVGFVFQHYALFRHMTVAENIGFGMKVRAACSARSAGHRRRASRTAATWCS